MSKWTMPNLSTSRQSTPQLIGLIIRQRPNANTTSYYEELPKKHFALVPELSSRFLGQFSGKRKKDPSSLEANHVCKKTVYVSHYVERSLHGFRGLTKAFVYLKFGKTTHFSLM